MKYKLERVGSPEDLHIEEEDILSAHPVRNGKHSVELTLRGRPQYSHDLGFEYQFGRDVTSVRLVDRQVQELVDQDRKAQTAFCNGCYDYNKRERPDECVRCQVLDAYRRAGKGDLRKVRPARDTSASATLPWLLGALVLLFWWAFYHWGDASAQLAAANRELNLVRKVRSVKR